MPATTIPDMEMSDDEYLESLQADIKMLTPNHERWKFCSITGHWPEFESKSKTWGVMWDNQLMMKNKYTREEKILIYDCVGLVDGNSAVDKARELLKHKNFQNELF